MKKNVPSSSSSTPMKKNHSENTASIHSEQMPSSTGLGLDGPILPSTSTFTLSSKDDKPEKLKKKAKNFLDERQKIKSRAQSLWSFIDATNTFDQARFFQEHAEQVFQVVFETCLHQIEKIKHKSERPQSWHSKELVNLQKTLLLLRKIFLYIPELMRNGWQRHNISIILTHILDHGNHPRLRALGFQLLLLWLNDQVVEYPECMNLFANAISLDLFILDEIQYYGPMASSSSSSTTMQHDIQPPVPPAPMQSTPHLQTPTNIHELDETTSTTSLPSTHKLHSSGLHFVKKLRESHADKQINHGLQRDEKIKSSSIQLQQRLILGDDSAPLYPNPVQPTYNDSIGLIHIFISNLVRLAYVAAGSPPPPDEYDYPPGDHFEHDDGIATGVGIDAATASAKFHFKIFRTHYMTKFVPIISKSLHVEGAAKTGVCGFPSCPPTILRCLLRFLIGYCLDNNNTNTHWPHLSHAVPAAITTSSPATPILKSIVLSSHETREMLHDILRQSLILPCTNTNYRDITRGAIHILGVWILGNEDERPSFLRRGGSTASASAAAAATTSGGGSTNSNGVILTRSSSTASVPNTPLANESNQYFPSASMTLSPTTEDVPHYEEYTDANTFLRRYLLMIKLVFDEDKRFDLGPRRDRMAGKLQPATDWEGLVHLYKDALNVYRAIAVSKGGIEIEWESWELMLQCLLDIQQWLMSQPEKYARIPVQSLAEELADYTWETLLHAFVRAKITHVELWHHLKVHLVSSMRWVQSLNQWARIMQKLTRLLSCRLYKVEYELYPDTKYRLMEDFPTMSTNSNHRYSTHFNPNTSTTTNSSNTPHANSNVTGSNARNKVRSRHLSMQGNPRLRRTSLSARPLSAIEGKLTDPSSSISTTMEDVAIGHQTETASTSTAATAAAPTAASPPPPAPEGGSVSTLLRNLSSASLSDIANTFKTDRKSTHLTSVVDEGEDENDVHSNTTKFGIKKPSSGGPSSASMSKRSNTNNSGSSSIGSGNGGSTGVGGNVPETRRTISIQQLDTLWQDSGSKLLNFVQHHGNDHANSLSNVSKTTMQQQQQQDTVLEKKSIVDWDHASASSIDEISTKSNRTSSSSAWPSTTAESMSLTISATSVTERLPSNLGSFKSTEFLMLSNLLYDGVQVLNIWKNMLLAIGNINQIEGPQNYAVAMQCVVEIWDTLRLVRAQQPYRDVPIPAMYEIAPWLFQATELPSTFDTGKATAYGSLCRLMSQKPEEKVPEGYYAAFYRCILKGLASNDTIIIQAVLLNSERLFAFSLPGVHILIPSFIDAIDKQLLNENTARDLPCNVRKSCITILGSLVSVSNHLKHVTVQVDTSWLQLQQGNSAFEFADVKVWLKNVFIRLVGTMPQAEQDTDSHCMLLGALCALALDELLSCSSPQQDIIHECILSLINHLYWCNMSIINTVSDCLNTIAHVYKATLDPEGIIVQEVLTGIIDSLNVHLKFYESNPKSGRGFIISKLFSCLLEWIMSIEPMILTETDLCQLVFDVIDLALHASSDGHEKALPRPPTHKPSQHKRKDTTFKFKLTAEKRPHVNQNHTMGTDLPKDDQDYVKESAEAVLLHLLHNFNNFALPYGPVTIHSTIIGPGVSQEDTGYHQYQYFSFNDTTIIAFVELPRTDTRGAQSRMIIRDLTGRYVWDTQLEPKPEIFETPMVNHNHEEFALRSNVHIQSSDKVLNDIKETDAIVQEQQDPMNNLLKKIGEVHPDCLLSPSLPLNVPSTATSLQEEMVGNLGNQLDQYLQDETQNNQESEGMLHRKEELGGSNTESTQTQPLSSYFENDLLRAVPLEAEKPDVPFQQSRLLLSHLGFIQYNQLKNGTFQMLNKTPALYRDLRGLDRKHGRETMKIGLIYVGHGQEDEQSILHNSQGSERYNAFVNSLGWEIDIATHMGYLGGLEKNLTNGTKATYYCSSSLEMIFHDVTKMPTDTSDPKQLKKKRHIGNDHVHIVWNDHDRDYRIDTIGGDFGNAQIIVTPLPDNLYAIQVYRDAKIPYFGPLFDRMIVSQAILGPLVRSTAVDAFRASVHTNLYSFYKCVYAQRANDVRTITNRHRVANWSYEQFMEKIFMPEEHV